MDAKTAEFEVAKALAQIRFVDRSYQLGLWKDETEYANWLHDLALMRSCEDLARITLELLSRTAKVVAQFSFDFGGQAGATRVFDSAQGIELPLIDRSSVVGKRLVVHRRGREGSYRHLLRVSWSPAAALAREEGRAFASEHAARITGGRQSGSFFVAERDRHRLQVTQTGERGFAFARDLDLDGANVFLLAKFAKTGVTFVPGAMLRATVVQTPRGLQARDIEAA